MQHEVTKVQDLLDEKGHVAEPGWARRPVWNYSRDKIAASAVRIKEWDYYLAVSDTCAAAFTLSDLGYAGMISVSLIDFEKKAEHTETILPLLPLGRMKLSPVSGEGVTDYRNKRVHLRYTVKPGVRRIQCSFKNFKDGESLTADLVMKQPDEDTMCIATPWKEDAKAFYYNEKINCMPVRGTVSIGDWWHRFNPKTDMSVLDWGRGVWTYDNTWYWGTCSTRIDGIPFGFNLGYGFSDRSSASENVIFYDGKANKLEDVKFIIPENDEGKRLYTKPWAVTSSDGRFEGVFEPIVDRNAKTDLKLIVTDQNQVFGHMTGTAILDDGTEIKMREVIAALEVVHNKY